MDDSASAREDSRVRTLDLVSERSASSCEIFCKEATEEEVLTAVGVALVTEGRRAAGPFREGILLLPEREGGRAGVAETALLPREEGGRMDLGRPVEGAGVGRKPKRP